jgi:hypothetical protein
MAEEAEAPDARGNHRVLLIGMGSLADATSRALEAGGCTLRRLADPTDAEIREELDETIDEVVVVSRYDHVSLRLALVVEHLRPGIPSLVTVFDRDVATRLHDAADNVRVLSMADLVAPAFAAPCVDPELLCLVRVGNELRAVKAVGGVPQVVSFESGAPGPWRRFLAALRNVVQPFDVSARILVVGLLGFFAVLVLDTIVTMLAGGLSFVDAIYTVAKVTVTVGPSEAADRGADWFKIFSAASILVTLGFVAVLTAGLVNRLLDPRLTGIVGSSAVPHRDQVVVVGLGQVGLRLCMLLRELGIPVVSVEQNPGAKNVARGKDLRLPVVIGSGGGQRLLRRLSIDRARALAAVTSDEVENIAIAVAARGVREDLTIALRAGDGEATSETRSLFGIGVIRDVYRIAGGALAASAMGHELLSAFIYKDGLYLVGPSGSIEPFADTVTRVDSAG